MRGEKQDMENSELRELRLGIEDKVWTVNEERTYLGMSGIGQCPRKLYNDMVHGRRRARIEKQRVFYEGYLHERDVIERLSAAGWPVSGQNTEIVGPWEELRGHVDGVLTLRDGSQALLEVKSTRRERFDRVREQGPLAEHIAQVTLYMRYGGWPVAVLIYKCREDGDVWLHLVEYDVILGDILERKAEMILEAVSTRTPPECTCGYCRR